MRKSTLQRFEEKYIPEPNSGCWLWTAAYSEKGHSCDTPECVNPDHLLACTQKNNIHDSFKRGRSRRNYWYNLNSEKLKIIRKQIELGYTAKEIASNHNISENCVYGIKSGRAYKIGVP